MFYLKNPKDEASLILLKSWHLPKSLPLVWSTGITAKAKDWSTEAHQFKKSNKNHVWLNATLAQYSELVEDLTIQTKAKEHRPPTHEELRTALNALRDKIDARTPKSKPSTQISFLDYCAQYVERMKNNPKYAERTWVHPNTTLTNLRLYCKHQGRQINWADLTFSLFEDWQVWNFSEVIKEGGVIIKDQLSQNTVAGYWKKFKAMLKAAALDGHYAGTDHTRPELALSFQVSDQIYFDVNELMAIYKAKLPASLERERDLILFNAFCGGFRFADMKAMGHAAIIPMNGPDGLRFHTSKTDDEVVIPGSWFFEEFRAKYPTKWPKVVNEQHFNESIKEIARIAGITQKVRVRINKGGKDIYDEGPKWEFAHQYTLRYSFATNLDEAGVDINDISRLMGHKVLRTTQGYIKTRMHKVAEKVAGNAYFTTKPTAKSV
jgi:site-specific recombinase XerD